MRALVVSNMYPTPERPALGSFVRDQVQALRRLPEPELELELFSFAPGGPRSYLRAATELGRRFRGRRFDVVHAHYGLTIYPSRSVQARTRAVTLHGTDLAHPRSRAITLASLPFVELVGVVSQPLAARLPGWSRRGERLRVLPCGVDLHRFARIDRAEARRELELDPDAPCLLFPADERRREKRFDRAREVAGDTRLLTLGDVAPSAVPTYVNAANAVLVTSERESFGLAALEALACDVPVLSTPVGVAPEALRGVAGTLCAPFEADAWRAALAAHLADADPRLAGGRARAEAYSSDVCARRVFDAWTELLERDG